MKYFPKAFSGLFRRIFINIYISRNIFQNTRWNISRKTLSGNATLAKQIFENFNLHKRVIGAWILISLVRNDLYFVDVTKNIWEIIVDRSHCKNMSELKNLSMRWYCRFCQFQVLKKWDFQIVLQFKLLKTQNVSCILSFKRLHFFSRKECIIIRCLSVTFQWMSVNRRSFSIDQHKL